MSVSHQIEELNEETSETFGPATLRSFDVEVEGFEGPFDLLLRLIAKRDLDVTAVSLAQVTEEFLEHIRTSPDLSAATDFLVVAATLLDMKTAALLPQIATEETQDQDLEARDLLFARLLQYRAFKDASAHLAKQYAANAGAAGRAVPLETQFAKLLPKLTWSTSKEELAVIAAQALMTAPRPDLADHVARPAVSMERETYLVHQLLLENGHATFRQLIAGATSLEVVVSRFLVILELYRRGQVSFDQRKPMGELVVTLTQKGETHGG